MNPPHSHVSKIDESAFTGKVAVFVNQEYFHSDVKSPDPDAFNYDPFHISSLCVLVFLACGYDVASSADVAELNAELFAARQTPGIETKVMEKKLQSLYMHVVGKFKE